MILNPTQAIYFLKYLLKLTLLCWKQELVEKRRKLMQEYEDRRKIKQEEYAAQRSRRIELRNSKLTSNLLPETSVN